MSHARASLQQPLRLLVLSALLLVTGIARADDYADVNQLLRSGRNAEALARADQFLKAKPRDPQMRFLKGVIQSGSGQVNEAIATFSGLTEDFPELPEPHNNLGLIYERSGQLPKAEAAYAEARRLEPDNPEYLGNLARARVRRGDRDPGTRRLLEELVLRDTRPLWVDWARRSLLRLSAEPPAFDPATAPSVPQPPG